MSRRFKDHIWEAVRLQGGCCTWDESQGHLIPMVRAAMGVIVCLEEQISDLCRVLRPVRGGPGRGAPAPAAPPRPGQLPENNMNAVRLLASQRSAPRGYVPTIGWALAASYRDGDKLFGYAGYRRRYSSCW